MSTQPTSIAWGPRAGTIGNEPTSDLQQMVARVLAILSQRRWIFVFPLLTGMLLALIVSLYLPRRYVLNTLFERRDDVVITNLVTNNSPYSFETLRRSLGVDLMGYNALDEAVASLGLDRNLPRDASGQLTPEARTRKQAMLNGLARQLEVNLAEKSTYLDLIELRYTGPNPEMGVMLVARLKDNYIKRTRERIAQILKQSNEFFSQEAGKRRDRVARMEAELLQMTVLHPGVDPSDPAVLDQRLLAHNQTIEELTRRKAETETKLTTCKDYLRQLEGGKANSMSRPVVLLPNTVPNPRRQRLLTEIDKVETELSDAKSLKKMTDMHPTVVTLRQKLDALRQECDALPEAIAADQRVATPDAPVVSPIDAERRRAQMEVKTLNDVLAQIDGDIARHQKDKASLEEEKGKLFERRQTFLVAQQSLQSAKADLNVWEGHVEAISRVLAAEAEARGIQFSTVDDARRPGKPVSPTFGGILLISAAAGLALAIAAVFLREILDRSFRNAHRVRQALGIPVLETIGEIRVGRTPRLFSRRYVFSLLAGVEGIAVVAAAGLAYLSVERPVTYEQVAARATAWYHADPIDLGA